MKFSKIKQDEDNNELKNRKTKNEYIQKLIL